MIVTPTPFKNKLLIISVSDIDISNANSCTDSGPDIEIFSGLTFEICSRSLFLLGVCFLLFLFEFLVTIFFPFVVPKDVDFLAGPSGLANGSDEMFSPTVKLSD